MAKLADAGQNGGDAPRFDVLDNAKVLLKDALGLPMQIMSDFKGTAEIRLAIDAGRKPIQLALHDVDVSRWLLR